jgi:mono/diheme cytochrome c family protein
MNYPVWYIPAIGGPLVIALVAIVHVLVSHFAVGGGLWLVLTEKRARTLNKPFMLEYVKNHALFFMLLTMVLGAITGVGIWFTISLTAPDATSLLIHFFVFAWAIEWIFFVVEIVTAFLYYYTFDKIAVKLHLLIGWIYFVAAWASLFIINAILSFMLSPGKWPQTQHFWSAFFNPTFLSSTLFRTFLCFALAGGYALLTATRKLTGIEREELVRYNGKWILVSLLGLVPSLIWYYFSIPSSLREGLLTKSLLMKHSLWILLAAFIMVSFLVFLFTRIKAAKMNVLGAISILALIFIFFGSFEFMRESARKPYIIGNYMYPNGLKVAEIKTTAAQPILPKTKWIGKGAREGLLEGSAGEDLFRIQCYACHSMGLKNNILPALKKWNMQRINTMLDRLPGITPQMPPFVGSKQEREALARWLFTISHKDQPLEKKSLQAVSVSGKAVFQSYCSDCHDSPDEVGGKLSAIRTLPDMVTLIERLDSISEDMPPFEGNQKEKEALAKYLYNVSRKK